MPKDKKEQEAFYDTGWLPDGERILLVIAADTSQQDSVRTVTYQCLYKCQRVITAPEQYRIGPVPIPEVYRPKCAHLIDECRRLTLAQLDSVYAKSSAAIVAMCGAPSCRVFDLTLDKVSQLYMIGGFATLIQHIHNHTDFPSLKNTLAPIVSLPVIRDRRDDILNIELSE